jgi:hypothetical protein
MGEEGDLARDFQGPTQAGWWWSQTLWSLLTASSLLQPLSPKSVRVRLPLEVAG